MTRSERLLTITKRLIIMTSVCLLLLMILFGLTPYRGNRFMVFFAVVLYLCFLSKIVEGPLFPHFAGPPFTEPVPTTDDVRNFLAQTYPSSGGDLAKLLFWSFVSGFSGRFVPQIIGRAETKDE